MERPAGMDWRKFWRGFVLCFVVAWLAAILLAYSGLLSKGAGKIGGLLVGLVVAAAWRFFSGDPFRVFPLDPAVRAGFRTGAWAGFLAYLVSLLFLFR